MFYTVDWHQTVQSPSFWALRYFCDGTYRKFPGITEEVNNSFYTHLGNNDQGAEAEAFDEEGATWKLSFTFPEGFSWLVDYSSEDEMDTGFLHFLIHPTYSPEGLLIATEGPDDHLPGLRWSELKQIASCLANQRQERFDAKAVLPLLYPLIKYVSFDELEEVQHTLTAAWHHLHVLATPQIEQWLRESLTVYDKGQVFMRNERNAWDLCYTEPGSQQRDLWVQVGEDWKTISSTSIRHIRKDVSPFSPFFAMLSRYS